MLKYDNYNVKEAKSFFQRLFGLMFKKNINYALLFNNCRSIHTFFMLINIDVIAFDKNDKIVKKYKNIHPGKIIIAPKNTAKILEIPSKKSK